MDTVQLQCGSCGKLMAIQVAHLGGQVQCPHCRAVVQTPPRPAAPAPARGPAEGESIFAPEVTDDVFGLGPAQPLVEMPADPPAPAPAAAPTEALTPAGVEFVPVPPADGEAATEQLPADDAPPDPDPDLAALRPRPVYDRSLGPLIALIFLVPYALITTLFIAYLLMTTNRAHPLDLLPDPVPGKGAPAKRAERVIHDYPLAEHQKVPLGATRRVGDLEVTPQTVELKDGNLVLQLRVKNVSDEYAFDPIHDDFLKVIPNRPGGLPYTFLQSRGFDNLYGGHVEWLKGEPGQEVKVDNGVLAPGQAEVLRLTTMDKYLPLVEKIARSRDPLVWRVQLRRGPVPYHGKMVSATTVIGVAFSPKDIQKEA